MATVDLPSRILTQPSAATGKRVPISPLLLVADAAALGVIAGAEVSAPLAVGFVLLVTVVIGSQGGYRRRFSANLERCIGLLVAALAIATVVIGLFDDRSALALLHVLPVIFVAMTVSRSVTMFVVRRINERAAPTERALILGAGTTGVLLVNHLREHREYGLEPVGFIDRVQDDNLPVPLLGDVADLEAIVARTNARQLLIAFGLVPEVELVGVIRRCQSLNVDVWVVPRFFELGLGGQRSVSDDVWGINLLRLPRLALRSAEWRIKRVFDLAVSSIAIVLLSPAFLLGALAVRLSSPGPTFFRQVRVGQRGHTFELLKFRTMTVNDDSTTTWSVACDRRVTPIGRVMRRSCLDEIPQLLNVLRGDMSLVGPRPERPHFVDIFRGSVMHYDDRHRVPVGLTGLAQVNGMRGDTSIEQRAVFDNNYIENWTLWSDIAILARTFVAVVQSPTGHNSTSNAGTGNATVVDATAVRSPRPKYSWPHGRQRAGDASRSPRSRRGRYASGDFRSRGEDDTPRVSSPVDERWLASSPAAKGDTRTSAP